MGVLALVSERLGLGLVEGEAPELLKAAELREASKVEEALWLAVKLKTDALPVWVTLGVRVELPEEIADAVGLCDGVPLPVPLPLSDCVGGSVAVLVGEGEADLRALALEEEQRVLLGEKEGEREGRGEALAVRLGCVGEAAVLGLVTALPVC